MTRSPAPTQNQYNTDLSLAGVCYLRDITLVLIQQHQNHCTKGLLSKGTKNLAKPAC